MKWFCLGTVPYIQTDNSYPFLREIAFESFCLLLFAANTNHEKKKGCTHRYHDIFWVE